MNQAQQNTIALQLSLVCVAVYGLLFWDVALNHSGWALVAMVCTLAAHTFFMYKWLIKGENNEHVR
jgi:nicotinamide riboside transporter PnuC